jgi:glycosyltransferase involved in cell wall biosynthesis
MKRIVFILPEFKDGGGNRWSVNLANHLSEDYNIELFALKKENSNTIHSLNKNIKKNFYLLKNNNLITRLFLYFKIFYQLSKSKYKKDLVIITDPIISILSIMLYPRTIFRNIAADENSLFDEKIFFKYIGLLYVYKLLLNISYLYPKTKFFFITKYVFIKCPVFFKKKIFKSNVNINKNLIPPGIEDIFLNNEVNFLKKNIETICLFPRKQNFKGLQIFNESIFQIELTKLGIKKIILITNEEFNLNIIKEISLKLINPKDDKDIINNLDQSDLFISTSKNEGFSLPPIEAMARKVPVIMANSGGNLSYGVNGYNCLIYENNKAHEIINKIKMLINDNSLRERIILNGFNTAVNYRSSFLNSIWKDQIINYYNLNSPIEGIDLEISKLNRQILGSFKKYKLIFTSLDNKLIKQIFLELIFFPFLFIYNFCKLNFSFFNKVNNFQYRERKIKEKNIFLCFQDWSNYPNRRYKMLKNMIWYKCGITNFDNLFKSSKYDIKKYLYLSGNNSKKLDKIHIKEKYETIFCKNDYYDFGSYSSFYNKHKTNNNILIFCNSSISNESTDPFIDSYLDYFLKNKDIGLLGISGNSKNYQSLLFNNFTPHLQSIFFITTVEVINLIISKNNNIFPGMNATRFNKYSIIKKGEVVLSKIVLDLGFNIAIVKSNGEIFKFKKDSYVSMYKQWKKNYKLGDARLHSIKPSFPFKIIE